MIRHKPMVGPALTLLAALLAACAVRPVTPPPTEPASPAGMTTDPAAFPGSDLARTDAQGAVEFVVTPLNLGVSGTSPDFDVSMNTHDVDLGWDLAAQSVLAADTGLEVTGQSWPMGSGHHYEGTLSFPATVTGGEALLDDAATLTLTIRDTDVPERVFTWDLGE